MKGLIAGGVTGTVQFLQPIIRDGSLASSDIYRHLTGIDRNNEMRTLSSVPQQARQALADRYGTEWLEDFEEWAKRPFGLSIANAATIANGVRGKLNHHLLLSRDFLNAKAMSSSSDISLQAEGQKLIARYEAEDREIQRHIVNHAYPCGPADIVGIRCLSHMRDRSLSEDAKKLSEYLKQHPEFKKGEDICDEATQWIRKRCKYTSGHMVLKPVRKAPDVTAGIQAPDEAMQRSVATLRRRRGYIALQSEETGSTLA